MTKHRSVPWRKILIIVLMAAAAAFGLWWIIDDRQTTAQLEDLGYSDQQIHTIKEDKEADELIRLGPSALMRYALDQPDFIRYELYFISDEQLPETAAVSASYRRLNQLSALGYQAETATAVVCAADAAALEAFLEQPKAEHEDILVRALGQGLSLEDSYFLGNVSPSLSGVILSGGYSVPAVAAMRELGYTDPQLAVILSAFDPEELNVVSTFRYLPQLPELCAAEDCRLDLVPRYLIYLSRHDVPAAEAVRAVGRDEDLTAADQIDWDSYDQDAVEVADPSAVTVCVDKGHYLPEGWVPDDLTELDSGYCWYHASLRAEAAQAFRQLSDAAEAQGYDRLIAQSAYRTANEQAAFYRRYTERLGEAGARQRVALPGYSEHQTGLCADLGGQTTGVQDLEDYSGFSWLMENAHRYGFVQRFPQGKEAITGFQYESWHFRYVGVTAAAVMHDHGWTLEEYAVVMP